MNCNKKRSLKSCGEWDASTGLLPTNTGSGIDGVILEGNVFDNVGDGTINNVFIPASASIRAKITNPGQDLTKYKIYF